MDHIYQKASDTAVWLGEPRGTSEIEVIRDLLKRLEQLNVPEAERVSRDEELKKSTHGRRMNGPMLAYTSTLMIKRVWKATYTLSRTTTTLHRNHNDDK
jgi:adenylate kinase family enzyme